jgi:hypothetical protein
LIESADPWLTLIITEINQSNEGIKNATYLLLSGEFIIGYWIA